MDLPDDVPLPALIDLIRARTPARLFVGRSGSSYRTGTQLDLREDHAAARDAVQSELNLERDLGRDFLIRWKFCLVRSQASSKAEYLLRPDLGRLLHPESVDQIRIHCRPDEAFQSIRKVQGETRPGVDIQFVIGDGLSSAAVAAQVPKLLPLLVEGAADRGWTTSRPFAIRYCRVGILNDIGELLDPSVVVLLIGERPGLATADSLSAYLAYRPRQGQTDAHRNLISNIHARGTSPEEAAGRILALASQMMARQLSGVAIKEESAALPGDDPGD